MRNAGANSLLLVASCLQWCKQRLDLVRPLLETRIVVSAVREVTPKPFVFRSGLISPLSQSRVIVLVHCKLLAKLCVLGDERLIGS